MGLRNDGTRAALALLVSASLALGIVACAAPERSILITARTVEVPSASRIETIVVQVIPTTGTASPTPARPERVARTFDEINGDLPIHVAIHLQGTTPVMIHLVAVTNTGTLLYATRCYDVTGVVSDDVLLVLRDPAADVDADGYPSASRLGATCRDPGDGPTGIECDQGMCPAAVAGDCNDAAEVVAGDCDRDHGLEGRCIHPGAITFCGDGIDQDCRNNGGAGDDEPCIDSDGDGYPACAASSVPDAGVVGDGSALDGGVPAERGCDCNDMDPGVRPGLVEVCGNGIDDDCSGEPGGMGAFCDEDDDGYGADIDCDDADPDVHPGGLVLEQCCAVLPCPSDCECDGIDDNCNGLVDEHASCSGPDLDGDGHDTCTGPTPNCAACDCNDCDSGIHPGAVDRCSNGIDEDGIGGDAMCEATDTDRDGVFGGRDCNEGDPETFLDAPEDCRTAESESCGTGVCGVDVDMDGYGPTGPAVVDCEDDDAAVHPWATDVCNGVNDDCDADTDEVLDPTSATGCVTDSSCGGASQRCTVQFVDNLHHCGVCRNECNPGATLLADACIAGTCSCSTNAGGLACAGANDTCCGVDDGMGHAVAFPGCFDLDTSVVNCGGCGVQCDPVVASACTGGTCTCGAGPACGAGQSCCSATAAGDGACRDLQTDPNNCGECGFACGASATCSMGRCVCADSDHSDCDGDLGRSGNNGCEVDLRTSAENCGACRTSCTDENVASGSCAARTCVIGSCQPLFSDCNGNPGDGCETSLSAIATCGSCTMSCAPLNADPRCNASGASASCGYGSCSARFSDCDGNVVNGCETGWSGAQCGASCTNCSTTTVNATGLSCSGAGTCDYASCSGAFSDCDGARANGCESAWSASACGPSCANCSTSVAGATGAFCSSGACDFAACVSGATDCDGNRANGCEAWSASACGAGCTDCTGMVANVAARTCSGAGTCDYTTCAVGATDCDGNRANGCDLWSASRCGASCTNCATTIQHASGAFCTGGGACNYASCDAGFGDCDGNRANGCEASVTLDTRCGACTNDCTDQNVVGGTCNTTTSSCMIPSCTAGRANCDGMTTNGCEATTAGTAADCCGATCSSPPTCDPTGMAGFRCR